MRIFSKQRDCYDCFQETDDVIWSRENNLDIQPHSEDIKFIKSLYNDFPKPIYHSRGSNSADYNVFELNSKAYLLFLCGKVYPFYMAHYKTFRMNDWEIKFTSRIPSDFKKKMEFHYKFNEDNWRLVYNKFDDKALDDFKTNLFNNRSRIYKLFIDYKIPMFLVYSSHNSSYSNHEVIFNPILKDYGVQKIIDPFTIYQEIKFFLSNDLVEDPMKNFQMSDNLKRDSKGFDKWSFRRKVR